MSELVEWVVMSSCLSSTVFLLLTKFKVINWVQLHGKGIVLKWANCHFCICFWINVIIVSIATIVLTSGSLYNIILPMSAIRLIIVPFASASLTRFIIQ